MMCYGQDHSWRYPLPLFVTPAVLLHPQEPVLLHPKQPPKWPDKRNGWHSAEERESTGWIHGHWISSDTATTTSVSTPRNTLTHTWDPKEKKSTSEPQTSTQSRLPAQKSLLRPKSSQANTIPQQRKTFPRAHVVRNENKQEPIKLKSGNTHKRKLYQSRYYQHFER